MTVIRQARLRDAAAFAQALGTRLARFISAFDCRVQHFAAFRTTTERRSGDQNLRQIGSDIPSFAENDCGEIVGFVHGGPERTGRTDFRGEIYGILSS